jgi:membrane-bound lytic murein transglycosylase B
MRLRLLLLVGLCALAWLPGRAQVAVAPASAPPFEEWLAGLVAEARERGFSEALIQEALVGLEPLPQVIASDRNQAEAAPGFDRYLNARLTRAMTTRGRDLAAQHRTLLDRIEETYGVQRRFLLAIWGLESRFGANQGRTPIFRALATLAWDPRRATYFRRELFNALTMVDRGHIDVRTMTGSWAGAMGQTQFMPSSYLAYAVDFDGDGRRDIWGSPADALASIANYLKGAGWNQEFTWGREVRVSLAARADVLDLNKRSSGCSAIRSMTERLPLQQWRKMGVRSLDGSALPQADVSAGLVDVGQRTFLVYPNYDAILSYNCAHFYALTVALYADSLR